MFNPSDRVSREDREQASESRRSSVSPAEFEPGMGGNSMSAADDFFGSSNSSPSGGAGGRPPMPTGGSPVGGIPMGRPPMGGGGFGSPPMGGSPMGGSPMGSPPAGGGFGSPPDGFGSQPGGFGSPPMGGGGFGRPPMGGSPMGGGFGASPFSPSPMQRPNADTKSTEDKFFDVLKSFFVGFKDWLSHFIKSFSKFDMTKQLLFGRSVIIISIISMVTGVLGLFFIDKELFGSLLISGLVTCAVGVVFFMFSFDKFKKSGQNITEPPPIEPELITPIEPPIAPVEVDMAMDEPDEDEIVYDDIPIEEDDLDGLSLDDTNEPEEEVVDNSVANADSVLDAINIDRGMVTRQYLFDTVCSILPHCSANYNKVTEYDEDSDEFDTWNAIVQKSARVLATSDNQLENLPYLIKLKDKLLYYQLVVYRVTWLKNIDSLVNEIVNLVKYDDDGKEDTSIYGTGVYSGDRAIIKIMKGTTAMVSLRDAYDRAKDFVLNTKNKIPIVLGIDQEGDLVLKDFYNIHALCVSGMPRSGKSWLVVSIVTQMAMYMKSSELQFYIYDPKNNTSDFKKLSFPHIREFKYADDDIVSGLKYIIEVESERRSRILGDADCLNIDEFKKSHPDVEMPLLYVVIDEVITFASRMKESNMDLYKEFQSYLAVLVTRCPNLGIRLFMIPHVIKNDIIRKTTTDMIPCRMSVKGDAGHIESVTGAKPKDFPFALCHYGDMAVKLDSDKVTFCHAVVLSSNSDTTSDICNFVTRLWAKIEPESVRGSVYERSLIATQNRQAVNAVRGSDIDLDHVEMRTWDDDTHGSGGNGSGNGGDSGSSNDNGSDTGSGGNGSTGRSDRVNNRVGGNRFGTEGSAINDSETERQVSGADDLFNEIFNSDNADIDLDL